MSWPGRIPTNTVSTAQISLMDMYATFAAIAGEPLYAAEALHSFSVLDAMLNPSVTDHRPQGIYAVDKVKRDQNSLRDGGYKIIWNGSGTPTFVELYNLDADLGEATNLLGNATYAGVESDLKDQADTITAAGRMRPATSPQVWLSEHTTLRGADAALSADADGDGHSNLREFVFGSAPDNTNSVPDGCGIGPAGTNGLPVISFRRRIDHAEMQLDYSLEHTNRLDAPAWGEDGFTEVGSPVPSGDGLTEWVTMSYTNGIVAKHFIRGRVDVR
jgi:hypothetical protein